MNRAEAIEAAQLVFASPEFVRWETARGSYNEAREAYSEARRAYYKAWYAYNEAREAYNEARDTCKAPVGGIFINSEYRAFNLLASDRDGVYCVVLSRKQVWAYNGEKCPDPDTVEIIWKEKEETP